VSQGNESRRRGTTRGITRGTTRSHGNDAVERHGNDAVEQRGGMMRGTTRWNNAGNNTGNDAVEQLNRPYNDMAGQHDAMTLFKEQCRTM
jgi:hypothetical protein